MPGSTGVRIGPRGVTCTSSTASGCPFTGMISVAISHGRKVPSGWRTERPSGPIVSTKKSLLSVRPAVTPHAANPLCPMGKPGAPASVAPVTSQCGVRTCARYHGGGQVGARCGSLARSGLPDAVRAPATAQLFDPPPRGRYACSAARSAAR